MSVRLFVAIFVACMGIVGMQELARCCGEDGGIKKIKEPELAAELRKRFESDQAARKKVTDFYIKHKIVDEDRDLAKLDPPTAEKWAAVGKEIADEDTKNLLWLKEVVVKYGWPGKSLVGSQGAIDAWLLVQHADEDREFQQECLAKMEALPKGEVRPVDIAYLADRVLCGTGKKQKYGTQVELKGGKFIPKPIDDEEHVDERRKAIGLEPLTDYLKWTEKLYRTSSDSEAKSPKCPPSNPAVGDKGLLKPNAEVDISKIPFAVPAAVTDSIEAIASQCDILTLGEIHGTQEVPLLALALLSSLSKLGYNALALEIPKDQQASLIAWANGQTETVPEFFSKPFSDGRGNAQLLSLIRITLSQPYGWKLICFDQSMPDLQAEIQELKRKSVEGKDKPQASSFAVSDDGVAFWKKRDAAMASNLTSQLKQLTPRPKVLAICGNMHNRIENTEKSFMKQLWPSFAAVLKFDNADVKVGTINIRYHSGGFFNGGKVNEIQGRKIDHAEAHPAIESGYDWELNLPHATPATFLAPPVDPQ